MTVYRKLSAEQFGSAVQRLTQKELAACFGITDRAIRDWEGCPRNKDGTYNLPEVIKWRISKAQNLHQQAPGDRR